MNRAPAFVMPLMMLGAVAIAGVLTFSHPIEDTFPIHRVLAQQLRGGTAESDFTPLGYPWLLSRVPVESLDAAVRIVHFGCYLALVVVAASALQQLGSWNSPAGIAAAAFILLNPYVLVNLYRLNDTSLTVAVTLAFFFLMLLVAGKAATSLPAITAAGVVLALLIFIRPNAITLSAALAVSIWRSSRSASRPTVVVRIIVAAVVVLVTYGACSLLVARVPLFWPSNGPYNLFAGNNPAAFDVVKTEYNAETSLDEGLAWCGVSGPVRGVKGGVFVRCTTRFVRDFPAAAVKVSLFKFYNLMWRPNLRLADSLADVVAQALMVAPSVLWAIASMVVFVRLGRVMDPLATLLIGCFALPLVFTNTDPRLRLPLDPVFALSLASPEAQRMVRALFAKRIHISPAS